MINLEARSFLIAILITAIVKWMVGRGEHCEKMERAQKRAKALPEAHSYFADLPQVRNNPRIQAYLRASESVYQRKRMSICNVHVREDLAMAQFRFFVSAEDQANCGVMHGGESYFIVDSVIAALVMARFPEATPLTVKSETNYEAPCKVGQWYVVKVEALPTDPLKPKLQPFAYTIESADGGKRTMSGRMTYFPKFGDPIPDESQLPMPRWLSEQARSYSIF